MNLNFCPRIAREDYNSRGDYIPAWRRFARTHKNVKLSQIDCDLENFGAYSPAYITTNEDWRFAMRELNPKDKSVLTVTGSGDQPIAFAISGAKDIDTFDTSFFANVIMNMKTSAIQTLNLDEYNSFVGALADAKSVRDIPQYEKISRICPHETIVATKQMHGCKIFHNGIGIYKEYMPTESEYKVAKTIIKQPMNFIWSDLNDLHAHLNKKYDVIYLSNIFEYFHNRNKITNVINSLNQFLRLNGEIMLYTSWVHTNVSETIVDAAKQCDWGTVKSHETKNAVMLTLTKSR